MIRFSPIALSCVIAILATGTYMAWRGVGTLGALTGTAYGRRLLVKIAGLCALIGLGYLARRRIADGLQAPVAALRAAQPVAAAPARVKAGAATTPAGRTKATAGALATHASAADRTQTARTRTARGGVGSNGVGGNGRSSRGDAPIISQVGESAGNGGPDMVRMGVTLRRLRRSVAAETMIVVVVPVRLTHAGPGGYRGGPAVISTSGQWQLRVTVRSDAFDEASITIPFSVH